MSSNSASYIVSSKKYPMEVREAPYASAGPGEIVVKNSAVGIAPVDWKLQDYDFFPGMPYPMVEGTEVAGIVHEVGSGVTNFKKGDRVLSHAPQLRTKENKHGGFQEYTVSYAATTAPIPTHLSDEEAVVLPLALSTAAAALFRKDVLNLPLPKANPESTGKVLLIWGGASSVGSVGIQLARAAGVEVFTTASAKNHSFCKNLGASQVFDYTKPTVVEDIIAAISGKTLVGVFDAISDDTTQVASANLVKKVNGSNGILGTTLPPSETLGVQATGILAFDITDTDVTKPFWEGWVPGALQSGQLKPSPAPLVFGNGLDKIQGALDKQKAGVSAQKVVVTLK